MWNYETLKEEAARNRVRVAELLALAPQNDPFYVGRPSEIEAANWFYSLYREFGYTGGVHLRRIHYRIVSQDPPAAMPNGETYQNTEACWNFLNNAAKWARYLDLVPADQFVDRRNPDAIINTRFYSPEDYLYTDPTPEVEITESAAWDAYQSPTLPELPALPERLPDFPDYVVSGYHEMQQAYLVEIWAEKTTMNDILIPLCGEHGVNLVTGAGELSITAVIDFIKRVKESGKPARILYISDFDPAGLGMPVSVSRKIEFYLRQDPEPLDVKLDPIVLSPEQIEQYRLPRVPVKDTDKRKSGFEAAYGQGQVELDALEALHPGKLREIVQQAILNYYDDSLQRRAWRAKRDLEWRMMDEAQDILQKHSEDILYIEREYNRVLSDYSETRNSFATLIADFQPQLDAYRQRLDDIRAEGILLHAAVENEMRAAIEQIDLTLEHPLPDPILPDEPAEQLYESERSYSTQLLHYKSHRHNAKQLTLENAGAE